MEQEGLVKNIKRICEEKGVSIRALEADLEFSPGLISRWVRMNPSISKIIAVADYLGVSLDELVGRKEAVQKDSLVEKLLDDTKNKKLLWKPLEDNKEVRELNRVCGCCKLGEAYFIVEGYVDDNDKIENLSIYIVPNSKSAPVLQENIDEEEILPLFDEIRKDIEWKVDTDAAERVKENFLNNRER